MKHFKKLNMYKASNVTFNPETLEAVSYNWWSFVKVIEGKLVFNNYRYSSSTGKHQYKVKRLMSDLGIKIDVSVPCPKGLQGYETLEKLYLDAEEYLCNEFLREVLKRQENYLKLKNRKAITKQLTDYLENDLHFRDYDIKTKGWGRGISQRVQLETVKEDAWNALKRFKEENASHITFFVA